MQEKIVGQIYWRFRVSRNGQILGYYKTGKIPVTNEVIEMNGARYKVICARFETFTVYVKDHDS